MTRKALLFTSVSPLYSSRKKSFYELILIIFAPWFWYRIAADIGRSAEGLEEKGDSVKESPFLLAPDVSGTSLRRGLCLFGYSVLPTCQSMNA
jgi:hypothetical protein